MPRLTMATVLVLLVPAAAFAAILGSMKAPRSAVTADTCLSRVAGIPRVEAVNILCGSVVELSKREAERAALENEAEALVAREAEANVAADGGNKAAPRRISLSATARRLPQERASLLAVDTRIERARNAVGLEDALAASRREADVLRAEVERLRVQLRKAEVVDHQREEACKDERQKDTESFMRQVAALQNENARLAEHCA
eukprot:TRINITY_DN14954_c0_g1_i2.p1 TRINITY_DN14954_c0_g1~~TRINITY_DN14954_c0_g1_i2.p1  ORF type:complete len:202 (-),score=54.90 TRINITY_DN14954_c0_g1_i2:45-650(-)